MLLIRRILHLTVLVVLLPAIGFAFEADNVDEYSRSSGSDFGPQWQEEQASLPAYPRSRDLIRVDGATSGDITLFIDKRSVAVGRDGVARLTYVLRTSSGVNNVFYEGIRCTTREFKTYALGVGEDSFMALKEPVWQELPFHEDNTFRHTLARRIVCGDALGFRTRDEILRALR